MSNFNERLRIIESIIARFPPDQISELTLIPTSLVDPYCYETVLAWELRIKMKDKEVINEIS